MRRLLISLAVLPLLSLSGCATSLGYLWKQAGPLLHDSLGAKSIDRMLKDRATPPEVRSFLERVKAIKRFAVDRIGLSTNRNYTTYKAIDRNYLVSVVQASDALSFTAYEWKYPLLGKLPYRGYYDPADAKAEAARLENEGYDVIVRKVDAFSTLGFLRDPIYSYMSRYSRYELASLIIHEETHATVFLKGNDQFNEGLATYVGEQGALEYLRATYGPHSPAYEAGLAERTDSALFLRFIDETKRALSALYARPLAKSAKLAEKARIISQYEKIYRSEFLPRFRTKMYREADRLPINNAYLTLFGLYTRDIPTLQEYDRQLCGGNLAVFVVHIKRLARERGDVMAKIEQALATGRPAAGGELSSSAGRQIGR